MKITMEIENINIDLLKFSDYNPRILTEKQFEDIKKSIEKFGFVDPIIVNSNEKRKNIIIGGHQRVRVAKKLNFAEIPCVFINIEDLEKEKELNIRLNKNIGDWDYDKLANEFELEDLLEWGFEEENLLGFYDEEETSETIGDDDVPDIQEEVKTTKGDIYELGNHRLLCGDATIKDDVEKLMNGQNTIIMITDPPYGVNYEPEWRDDLEKKHKTKPYSHKNIGKVKNDDKIDWSEAYSLFNGDIAYVWHSAKYSHIVGKNLEECGFDIISQIIWAKSNFEISRGDYHWQHEPCFYAVKEGKKHNWQGSKKETTLWQIKINDATNPEKEETWGHGTQKPIECMLKPLINNTEKNQLVYDPFLGSGTTLIAAEKMDRVCYGIEIEEKYCDVIVRRYIDFCKKNDRKWSVKRNGKEIKEF